MQNAKHQVAALKSTAEDLRAELAVTTTERDRLCAQLGQETAARAAAEKERAQAEAAVVRLGTENAGYRVQIADLLKERDRLTSERDVALADAARNRSQTPAPAWSPIGKTFVEMCERMVDSSRLAGIEVETEDGERYLIGDVNPGGYREHGQAFRRDVVIARARVRVQR